MDEKEKEIVCEVCQNSISWAFPFPVRIQRNGMIAERTGEGAICVDCLVMEIENQ